MKRQAKEKRYPSAYEMLYKKMIKRLRKEYSEEFHLKNEGREIK